MPGVSIPIIDQLVHPSFGLLSRVPLPGHFVGQGNLAPPQNVLVALTYGFAWTFFNVPIGYGSVVGNPPTYDVDMIQLSVTYALLDSNIITAQMQWRREDFGVYLWDEPLPSALQWWLAPGVVADFYWLQT